MRYYKPVQSNGITYSCDMLRLTFKTQFRNRKNEFVHINRDRLTEVFSLNGYAVEEYQSNKASGYKHMIIIRKKEQVITLGLEHNVMTDNVLNHFLEFNPNKVNMDVIRFIIRYLKKYIKYSTVKNTYFEVSRWDLAVDIPVDRNYVKLLKKGRREYHYIRGSDGSITEYSGKRNTNGFCKVYDKTQESKLDYELTRIEVTVEGVDIVFPDIYLKEYQYSLDFEDINQTDRVIVEMLKRLDDEEQQYWFSRLGRTKQDKLRPYVFGLDSMFEFDKRCIIEVLDTVTDISQGQIEEEGSDFIATYNQWSDKYYKQQFAPAKQSSTFWKAIDENYARTLFGE